jgi:hypothetical protein
MWTEAFEHLESKEWALEHVYVDASLNERPFMLSDKDKQTH